MLGHFGDNKNNDLRPRFFIVHEYLHDGPDLVACAMTVKTVPTENRV